MKNNEIIDANKIDAERLRFLINQDIENNFPRSGLFIGRIPSNEVLTGLEALEAIDEVRNYDSANSPAVDYAREALLFRAFIDATIADGAERPLTPLQAAIKAAFKQFEPTCVADVLDCISRAFQPFLSSSHIVDANKKVGLTEHNHG
ncbi:hypothetical protein [Herminiimonas arsenitoxidans]|uniref:hypothetical protein n=1 Tax=Herminiimonas arsenitoxidans TaxID=1809410 RepID=UPI000970D7D3|nr:hypothetical protein [Herminiimonas arsenitoxidans]